MVVADPAALNSTDTAVRDRLIALSFTILLADDNSPTLPGDALNRELVFISDTVDEGTVGNQLCDARAPIIVAKASLYDEMNLIAPAGTNGELPNQTDIDIILPTHPIAGGLSGVVTILNSSNNIGWGEPKPSADQIATIVGNPTQVAIFAYDSDDTVTCAALPTRRVAFPLAASTGASLTAAGWTLFDAAVNWASTP